jgi:hypothetical protein
LVMGFSAISTKNGRFSWRLVKNLSCRLTGQTSMLTWTNESCSLKRSKKFSSPNNDQTLHAKSTTWNRRAEKISSTGTDSFTAPIWTDRMRFLRSMFWTLKALTKRWPKRYLSRYSVNQESGSRSTKLANL